MVDDVRHMVHRVQEYISISTERGYSEALGLVILLIRRERGRKQGHTQRMALRFTLLRCQIVPILEQHLHV